MVKLGKTERRLLENPSKPWTTLMYSGASR